MASSFYRLQPTLIGCVKMRVLRPCIPVPIGSLCRPLRRYSAGQSASRPPAQSSSIWTSERGAPAATRRNGESGAFDFATTDEKPYQWGNELIKPFGANGHPDSKIEHGEFEKDETRAVARLTDLIRREGFAFVVGVPAESAKPTEDLLRKIAFIRETHYGGFYDFIPDLEHADTAYTTLALAAHTDGTYFTDPPGLQAFHLLSHTDSGPPKGSGAGLGGQSLLVDGFYAAKIMKEEAPVLFDVLTAVGVTSHASGNKGITIVPDKLYPVIELDLEGNAVHRIRWNNDDRGMLPIGGKYSVTQWYEAARKWNEILRRKELEYWFQLEPGKVLIFDNWRALHGRSAFTGRRRICGGYINRDDFISRWRNTNYSRDQVLKQVIC
ncbi:hypothetical protein F4859DRAFT_520662 [Xylaria cf. heliscus]|nr:hypothetical protein F4859DRAFT_520662 [Xylaria cf. heliscus]